MVWKRRVLGLEEKPFVGTETEGRRKYGFLVWKRKVLGLEEKSCAV